MILAALALVVTLGLAAARAKASPSFSVARPTTGWPPKQSASTKRSIVHGVANLPVDIEVVKNFSVVRNLANVNFGIASDLHSRPPGFVTPVFNFVDIAPAGTGPFCPLLKTLGGRSGHHPPHRSRAYRGGRNPQRHHHRPQHPGQRAGQPRRCRPPRQHQHLRFAIGTYPSTFQVVTLQIPTEG
jgi:hypothetical protein